MRPRAGHSERSGGRDSRFQDETRNEGRPSPCVSAPQQPWQSARTQRPDPAGSGGLTVWVAPQPPAVKRDGVFSVFTGYQSGKRHSGLSESADVLASLGGCSGQS